MDDKYLSQKIRRKSFSGYFFLLGCAALPFFNDFPLFAKIVPSFRDLPTVFFIMSGIFAFFELLLNKSIINISRTNLVFVFGFIVSIWISVAWNYNSSSQICGEKICGTERLISSAISLTSKITFFLFFIQIAKNEGLNRIANFIRIGFYFSLSYVVFELIFLVIPYYLGYENFAIYDLIDGFFHLRENDYGGSRTRGLAFEPSYQAVYLIICLPFLLVDPIIKRRSRNIFAWIICLITAISATGFAAASIFVLFYKFNGRKLYYAIFSIILLCIFLLILSISTNFIGFLDFYGTNFASTITRSGSWVAGFFATLDNFMFGVGPGMSGYWVTNFYPVFFLASGESGIWYNLGRSDFDAPTFASLLTFTLEYGVISLTIAVLYLFKKGILRDALRSHIGRASLISIFIVSFGLSGFQVWGYFLFLAITLSRSWSQFDFLANRSSNKI